MVPDKILIDCGTVSLTPFSMFSNSPITSKIKDAKNDARFNNANFDFLIYSSMPSPFSGGRITIDSEEDVKSLAEILNKNGFDYNFVLNGGLRLESDIETELFGSIDPVLRFLSINNEDYSVKNKVTITHPAIFNHIHKNYPGLETIASCIQTLYPGHDYAEAFEKYDLVVPLNQHTTFNYLSQFSEYSDKMILFLSLPCASNNLAKCYGHYIDTEREYELESDNMMILDQDNIKPIPSQLEKGIGFCSYGCKHNNSDDASLLYRENDMIGLLKMGVNKFKVSRDSQFDRYKMFKLIDYMHKASQ